MASSTISILFCCSKALAIQISWRCPTLKFIPPSDTSVDKPLGSPLMTSLSCTYKIHYQSFVLHRKLHNLYKSRKVRTRTFEPARLTKIQISLRISTVWSESSTSSFLGSKGCQVSSCEQRRLISDRADAQADLNLCRAHIQKVHLLKLRFT